LPVIPALIQASVLALLSAAVPLRATATSTVVSVNPGSFHQVDPTPQQLQEAQSVHVFAFTSQDGLLLAESEGDFTFDEWTDVCQTARRICCGIGVENTTLDADMGGREADIGSDLRHFVRATAEAKVADDLEWKNDR
jgi:exosome complex component RRP46